jgi:hypothetical protein
MSKKDFNKVMHAIDDFAKNIAEEVANIRYYEVDRIKAIAATRLNFAIQELLHFQLLGYEEEKAKLVEVYLDRATPNWKKEKLKKEITALNLVIKKNNRLKTTFADYNEYEQLRHYVMDKFGIPAIKDFQDNYVNRGENAKHIKMRSNNPLKQ